MDSIEASPRTDASFSYVMEDQFVRITMGRTVNPDVIGAAAACLVNDPDYHKPMNLLIDDRHHGVPSLPSEARAVAAMLARYVGRFGPRFAILVGSSVQYGMVRILGALVQHLGMTIRPFREEADAVAWLTEAVTPAQPTP